MGLIVSRSVFLGLLDWSDWLIVSVLDLKLWHYCIHNNAVCQLLLTAC